VDFMVGFGFVGRLFDRVCIYGVCMEMYEVFKIGRRLTTKQM
jgi:hypothetical protein